MKRLMFLLFAFFLFLAVPVSAEEMENDNIQKAGKKELTSHELLLQGAIGEIEKHIDSLIYRQDSVLLNITVDYKWFKKLDELIVKFDRVKNNADKGLKFYNLKTEAKIPEEIRRIRDIYFANPYYGDNAIQEIRTFFTGKTGVPVIVIGAYSYFLMFYIIVLILLMCFWAVGWIVS